MPVSRREFLRLRRTGQDTVLEVSCRTLYMRMADAALPSADPGDWEPWMGEPPAVHERQSVDDLVAALADDLRGAQIVRLLDAEWLEASPAAGALRGVIAAFESAGGRVQRS